MARCAHCRAVIIGSTPEGRRLYCSDHCYNRGYVAELADRFSADEIDERTAAVYRGACPECGGPGPVDLHTAYRVWSAGVVSVFQKEARVACRACARKRQLEAALFCAALGWWGVPFGLFGTPVQIARNLLAIRRKAGDGPSGALRRLVIEQLAGGRQGTRRPRDGTRHYRCEICRFAGHLDPSTPLADACCPKCGVLLFPTHDE